MVENFNNMHDKMSLDARQLMVLDMELKNRGKDMVVGYLLWFFLSGFGAHRFYMKRVGSAIAQLLLFWISFIILMIGVVVVAVGDESGDLDMMAAGGVAMMIGALPLIAASIWILVDAFLLHGWIKDHNQKVEAEIIQELHQQ